MPDRQASAFAEFITTQDVLGPTFPDPRPHVVRVEPHLSGAIALSDCPAGAWCPAVFPYPFFSEDPFMSMYKTAQAPTPSFEIERSDLDAVRRFLTGDNEVHREERRRPSNAGVSKGPTVRHGITRARLRSVAKAGE